MFAEPDKNIGDRTIHLHVVEVSSSINEVAKDTCLRLLSPEEKIKWRRFRFEKDKNSHLITRALVRTQLSNYLGEKSPDYWEFQANKYGKPFVSNNNSDICLNFNISHTKNYVICAFVIGCDLGVDVEYINDDINIKKLAPQYYSSVEVQNLFNLPFEKQLERFYEFWTFKEAYIKAIGMGLSMPLDDFSIRFDKENIVTVEVRNCYGFTNRNWQFKKLAGFKNCKAAICIENNFGAPHGVQVETFKTRL